ncbi:hypothetical protein JW949_00940 [Candidatus Woesearchaeota archaeon]|nr:hypothetical protein [Candidatus Woesearchaeota archaeon]
MKRKKLLDTIDQIYFKKRKNKELIRTDIRNSDLNCYLNCEKILPHNIAFELIDFIMESEPIESKEKLEKLVNSYNKMNSIITEWENQDKYSMLLNRKVLEENKSSPVSFFYREKVSYSNEKKADIYFAFVETERFDSEKDNFDISMLVDPEDIESEILLCKGHTYERRNRVLAIGSNIIKYLQKNAEDILKEKPESFLEISFANVLKKLYPDNDNLPKTL